MENNIMPDKEIYDTQNGGNASTYEFIEEIDFGSATYYFPIITNNGNGSAFDNCNDEYINGGNAYTITDEEIDEKNAGKIPIQMPTYERYVFINDSTMIYTI